MRGRSLLILLLLTALARADEVSVTLRVTAPAGTSDTIHLAGSGPALGNWKPDGLPLRRGDDGTHQATLRLPRDARIEFKFTRGSWPTVEMDASGQDIPNRTLIADKDTTLHLAIARWPILSATRPTSRPSTRTGDIRVHDNFDSATLDDRRTLYVYLPPNYEKDSAARYPVLYMHDGQNLFDTATSFAGEWRADETAEALIANGRIRPIIIVGVSNTRDRLAEYTPSAGSSTSAGRADAYARFLLDEVKPFIDRTYRTRPGRDDTAVAGSSLGGLVSLYLLHKHPDRFAAAGVLSPSLWWDNQNLLKHVARNPAALKGTRVYLSMGTAEGSHDASARHVAYARELAEVLEKSGLTAGKDFAYRESEGVAHNELAWSMVFGELLVFLFPPTKP